MGGEAATSRRHAGPATERKMTLCCVMRPSKLLPDSAKAKRRVYLRCLYGCKIYCCVLKCVQLGLCLSATPGQHTIIFTLTRQQMQPLAEAPSLGIQSVRQARQVEPTCYRAAKVASAAHVFFGSRHLLNIPPPPQPRCSGADTWPEEDGWGAGWGTS